MSTSDMYYDEQKNTPR